MDDYPLIGSWNPKKRGAGSSGSDLLKGLFLVAVLIAGGLAFADSTANPVAHGICSLATGNILQRVACEYNLNWNATAPAPTTYTANVNQFVCDWQPKGSGYANVDLWNGKPWELDGTTYNTAYLKQHCKFYLKGETIQ